MLFADDIALIKTRASVNYKLELWRGAPESKGLKLNRTKIEYMEYKFSSRRQRNNELVTIAGEEVTNTNKFCYLGSIIVTDK